MQLNVGKQILWCYLIWYLVICTFYFDPDLILWGRCLGLGGIVGFALVLSTGPATIKRLRSDFWQVFRLCACPFLVSSFSTLVKGKSFILIFSPFWHENLIAFTICLLFVLLCFLSKKNCCRTPVSKKLVKSRLLD